MTIAIAKLCDGGAIVAADTKVTRSDGSVTYDSKLTSISAKWGGCTIADSSNDGNAAKTLVRAIATSLDRTNAFKEWNVFEQTVVYEMTNWNQAYREAPPTQLIIGAGIPPIGAQIYFCEPPNTIVPHPEGYVAAGAGSSITDPLHETLFAGSSLYYDPQRTMRIIAYLMYRAKHGHALCGGRTYAMYVKTNGAGPELVRHTDFEAAENESRKLDFLLRAAATFALFSTPGDNLDHNAKGIGEMMKGLAGLRATVFHNIQGEAI